MSFVKGEKNKMKMKKTEKNIKIYIAHTTHISLCILC